MDDKQIRQDREAVYGSHHINMDAAGLILTGLLEHHYQIKLPHPVPGHVVSLYMACAKAARATGPGYTEDNYNDMRIYAQMAQEEDLLRRELQEDGSTGRNEPLEGPPQGLSRPQTGDSETAGPSALDVDPEAYRGVQRPVLIPTIRGVCTRCGEGIATDGYYKYGNEKLCTRCFERSVNR